MQRNFLEFGLSAWWVLPAMVVALGLSYWLYSKKGLPWNKTQNLVLASLRFLGVLLILLLLLEPYMRIVENEIERPVLVFGIDNSASIASIHEPAIRDELVEDIIELAENLREKNDYRVELLDLQGDDVDSMLFDDQLTDYSYFFNEVNDTYGSQNLKEVILITDGIHNRGISPEFRSYAYPVVTIGLGDTIPPRDVSITKVRHNAVAYSGNEFPIQFEVSGEGYVDESFQVKISSSGNTLKVEKGVISALRNEMTFFLSSDQAGIKHYTIEVTKFDGEVTYENNTHEMFIDVLESKKQVLIYGLAPHPDMRAIRSALEETGNYEVTLFIHGIQDQPEKSVSYDVQILFNGVSALPRRSGQWVINSSSDGSQLEQVPFLSISSNGQPDNVIPALNPDFSSFKLNREPMRLSGYPPIEAPFGVYKTSDPLDILLYQRVGSVVTDKPLLAVVDNGSQRTAISVGQGIWQWKLQEAARYGDHRLFTEIVQKLVQYLSINDSRKQFRVANGLDIFTEGEVIFFDVEIYDDIFQPLEGQPYNLSITNELDEKFNFEYVFGSENKVARTTSFPPGKYSFQAVTIVGEKRLQERGEFVINALQLEQRELTARHDVLRRVSEKSNGRFFHMSQMAELKNQLLDSEHQGIIHSNTTRKPLNDEFWLLLLIGGFFCAEWILRKYWGAY